MASQLRAVEQEALDEIWEAQPGPQSALIACPIFEVFFGGARGGGKTDGVLGDFLEHEDAYGRHAIGLMIRRTRTELIETIERSRQMYGPLGWSFNDTLKMWRSPRGGRLRFAYLGARRGRGSLPGAQLHAPLCRGDWQLPEPGAGPEADGNLALGGGRPGRLSRDGQSGRAGTGLGEGPLYRPCPVRLEGHPGRLHGPGARVYPVESHGQQIP